ncbi:MAG: PAS domain S-box protein [Stellaceae bacterium]
MPWRAVAFALCLGGAVLLAAAAMLAWPGAAVVLAPAAIGVAGLLAAKIVFLAAEAERRARSRDALARSAARLRAIVDSAPDAIFIVDDRGGIVEFNAAAERIFARARGDALGREMAELLVPERHRAAHREAMRRYLAAGEADLLDRRLQLPALRADGSEFPAEVTVTPVRLDGRICFAAHLRDITRRKATEERLALLQSAVRHARDSVLITEVEPLSGDGPRIVYVNDAFTAMTGYAAAEAIGRTPRLLQGPKTDPASLERLRTGLQHRQSLRVELLYYRKDGAEFWVEVDIAPIADIKGRLTHFIAIQRETTARHRDEEELIRAKAEAEHAGKVKSQFLATMSHEMRTPLNGIIGTAELLLDTPLAADQRELAVALQDSGKFLRQLVDGVLDFSKMETARLELRSVAFDLRALAERVVEGLRPQAARKGLALALTADAALPARLVGDPDRVRQVLFNLVSNGIKFTDAGSVAVAVALERQDEDAAVIAVEVRDTGIGIAPDAVPLLFREFVQLDGSISRRFGGSGLGLAIADRLVKLMGGTIAVESAPGKGSRFSVTVTFGRAGPAPEPDTAAPGGGRRLLLVEDDDINRLVATSVLTKLGYVVDVAGNGHEAVARARSGGYALVLMDVMMPEMDGLQAARAIRALPPPAGAVPILALSANSDYARACAVAGMDGFLAKPVTPAGLASGVARVLSRAIAAPPGSAEFEPARLGLLTAEIGTGPARELVEVFFGDAAERLAAMRQLIGSGERKTLERAAHSVKSSAATFGFERLAGIAREIESAAQAAPEPQLLALADAAATALDGGRRAWHAAAVETA